MWGKAGEQVTVGGRPVGLECNALVSVVECLLDLLQLEVADGAIPVQQVSIRPFLRLSHKLPVSLTGAAL